MTTLQWGMSAAAVLLLFVWLLLRRRAGSTAPPSERLDTLTGWPPQATRVLNSRESIAFAALVHALPEYMVLAQVPLARFLSVPKRNSYADWLRRLGYQCVDFAVCDMAAQVIAVIELQPPGAISERARKRAERMARTLKAARIRLLVWPDNALPSADAMRAAILPAPAALAPATPTVPLAALTAAAPAAVATPTPAAPAANPFAEVDRDSSQDETIELLEPPPSTWFDEIDSGPAPLRKR
jgi:hypothetical protein